MASSALETLVSGAVLDVASCAVVAAPPQAVDSSMPQHKTSCFVFALCLWDARRTRRFKMPASRCQRPACFKAFNQPLLAAAASIDGVLFQQRQRFRDGIAAARGPLSQQPAVGSAQRLSLEHECALCVDIPRLSTLYPSSVCTFCKESTHYRS